ncbi:hypothetical protein HLI_11675 [Halobacillus litoralis]|uniref:DUF3383 domain-containing protein n=2 Tax=Halobacillus litoralis TaxID=45668 RepID=A0A410MDN0_9BACI|nr:hypothetical protein HLI_11675 [Halobacillus litoralis]
MMPLNDFQVNINLQQPLGLVGFGKPLIVGEITGGLAYQEFLTLEALAESVEDTSPLYQKAQALLNQENRPERFAVAGYDSAAVDGPTTASALVTSLLGNDWYFLITTETDVTEMTAIADVIEGSEAGGYPKLYSAQVASVDDLTTLVTEYERSFFAVHPADEHIDAAHIGENGSKPVGSITWKSKSLTGITPQALTADELTAIEDANGYAYVKKAGQSVTSEGKVLSGEYIDVVHGLDWVVANIENRVQKITNQAGKIPYDDSGIAQLEAGTLSVLKEGFSQGIIADDGNGNGVYSTNFRSSAQSTAEDRKNRVYTGGNFEFQLAGAIHEGKITGSVSY